MLPFDQKQHCRGVENILAHAGGEKHMAECSTSLLGTEKMTVMCTALQKVPSLAPLFQRGSGPLLNDINFQRNMNVNSFPYSQAPFQEQKVHRGKTWLRR